MVCDVSVASVVSSYDEAFIYIHLNFFEVKWSFQYKIKQVFCASVQDVVVRNYKKSPLSHWRYFQNHYREEEYWCIEEPPFSRCDHVVCVSAHEHSCHRIFVGGSRRLECDVREVVDMHCCGRFSYPQLGKLWVSRRRQVFSVWFCCCLYPVGYCFDCCCFIFCTSPPGYESGEEGSEEAADRRRGLLKTACLPESAVSVIPNSPWSDSTSVRKSILLNWMSLSFLSSTSACYWDPGVAFRLFNSSYKYAICSVGGEYNTSSHNFACDCPCDDLVEVKTPPRSVMALSYIAQALVVTIVGLNMGFRWCVGVSYMRGVDGEVQPTVKQDWK